MLQIMLGWPEYGTSGPPIISCRLIGHCRFSLLKDNQLYSKHCWRSEGWKLPQLYIVLHVFNWSICIYGWIWETQHVYIIIITISSWFRQVYHCSGVSIASPCWQAFLSCKVHFSCLQCSDCMPYTVLNMVSGQAHVSLFLAVSEATHETSLGTLAAVPKFRQFESTAFPHCFAISSRALLHSETSQYPWQATLVALKWKLTAHASRPLNFHLYVACRQQGGSHITVWFAWMVYLVSVIFGTIR